MGTVARSSGRANGRARPAGPLPPAIPPFPVRRFTLDEYHRLIRTGFFREDDRVELLNGWIVAKMGTNPAHASALTRTARRLRRLLGDDWIVREQSSLTIPNSDSEPEPDILVARGPEEAYDARHPQPKDTVLLVEIAESSLAEDRGEKLRTYAAARVGVYWVVNLVDRRVEVYTRPRGGRDPGYRHRQDYGPGEAVPVVVAGRELGRLAVEELLP